MFNLNGASRIHPLPGEVLSYRSLAKLKSTFIDNMPALVNEKTAGSTLPLTRP